MSAELEAWFRQDMREHPENWLWLWRKITRQADGTPVPEQALRAFWGIPADAICPEPGAPEAPAA